MTPKQLFEHQTIAELAQVVKEEQGVQAEQGIITGETILTPIQQRFLRKIILIHIIGINPCSLERKKNWT